MITNLSLIALAVLTTIGAPAVQGQDLAADEGWQVFDGVALIVNDEIVTLRKLDSSLTEARGNAESTTEQDALALRDSVIEESINSHLQVQAGRSLGISGTDIERTIDGFLSGQRRGMSAVETAKWLEDEGASDLGQLRDSVRKELYRTLWIQSISGQSGGAERPSEDRYVRPGQLQEAYHVNKGALGNPSRYILQYLRLVTNAWGDAETALEVATDLRGQIADGADMGAFVDEYGAYLRQERGITKQIAIEEIAEAGVRAFLADARRGALSMVIPYFDGDEIGGYDIVRVVEIFEGNEAPPFHEASLQTTLQRGIQTSWDNARVLNGADNLWRTAYIKTPKGIRIDPPWVRRAARLR